MTDTSSNMLNGHAFVDLGLPSGLLWATCNVGATSPEQAGLYFAWGETTGYTAEQVKAGERKFFKNTYRTKKIKQNLTLEQDAAHVNMGRRWRMPTYEEFQELIDNCDAVWMDDYNGTRVAGILFTSKANGGSVFFPAAGFCRGSMVYLVGSGGYYWSTSWDLSIYAWGLYFHLGSLVLDIDYQCFGHPVRGVCKK